MTNAIDKVILNVTKAFQNVFGFQTVASATMLINTTFALRLSLASVAELEKKIYCK